MPVGNHAFTIAIFSKKMAILVSYLMVRSFYEVVSRIWAYIVVIVNLQVCSNHLPTDSQARNRAIVDVAGWTTRVAGCI